MKDFERVGKLQPSATDKRVVGGLQYIVRTDLRTGLENGIAVHAYAAGTYQLRRAVSAGNQSSGN